MNTCLIRGNCYAADEVNPKNPYERCDPQLNNTDWTEIAHTGTTPTGVYVTGTTLPTFTPGNIYLLYGVWSLQGTVTVACGRLYPRQLFLDSSA